MSKTCRICKQTKPLELFYKHKTTRDGYWHECKACVYQRKEDWKRKNPEKVRGERKRYYEKNKKLAVEYHKNWRSLPANRAKLNALQQFRSSRMKSKLTPAYQAEVDGFYLFCKIFTGFEVDHVVPLNGKQVSGLHVPANLQVLPIRENRKKGCKFPQESYT